MASKTTNKLTTNTISCLSFLVTSKLREGGIRNAEEGKKVEGKKGRMFR